MVLGGSDGDIEEARQALEAKLNEVTDLADPWDPDTGGTRDQEWPEGMP
jgi:hypothetical protein